jgi:hypothetical protein
MVWGNHGGIDDRPHQEIAQNDKPWDKTVTAGCRGKIGSRSMECGFGDTRRISLGVRFMGPTGSVSMRWATVGARGCNSMLQARYRIRGGKLEQTTLHSVK